MIKTNIVIIILVLLSLALSNCATKTIKKEDKKLEVSVNCCQQIVNIGYNRTAYINSDASKILYISQKRVSHDNPELYEYSFENQKSTRLTFQDGEILSATFLSGEEMVAYTSNTDLLKEYPKRVFAEMKDDQYFEIYVSDKRGADIDRLTQNIYSESTIQLVDESRIGFIRKVENEYQIIRMNMSNLSSLILYKTSNQPLSMNYSKKLKSFYWIEQRLEKTVLILLNNENKNTKEFNLTKDDIDSIVVDGENEETLKVYVSVKLPKTDYYEIKEFDLKTAQYKAIASEDGDLKHLAISPNGDKLFVSFYQEDGSSILVKNLSP